MKRIFTAACLASFFISHVRGAEFIWGVTGASGAPSSLYAINPANGQVLGLIGATGRVNLSGLAIQPGTGALLAAQGQLSPTGASSKGLFRIDKATGVASVIGILASKYAISDLAMRSDGTLFAFGIGQTVKKLLTVNTSTAAVTEIGNLNDITNVSLTFVKNTLYLVRSNGLFTVNQTTGVMSANPIVVSGATTLISNFMATNASGVVYAGLRAGGSTTLYRLDPLTGVTTNVGVVPGVALIGITFDNAVPPTLTVTGKKKIKTAKSSITLKGKASSLLPLTVSTKKTKAAKVVAGKWTLKVKLKPGKNVLKLACVDGFGQSAAAKVTVVRD